MIENDEASGPGPTPAGRGGHRPGAGRKPDGYIAKLEGDVAYARALVRALMRDEARPMGLRARCALAILEMARPGARENNQKRRKSSKAKA